MHRPKVSVNDIGYAAIELQEKWIKIQRIWEAYFPGWKAKLGTVYRSPEDQLKAFQAGASQIDGFKKVGKHNKWPSQAIDINFYNSEGKWIVNLLEDGKITRERFDGMYGILGLLGHIHGLRWGNDWNGNLLPVKPDPNESFVDVYHLETKG